MTFIEKIPLKRVVNAGLPSYVRVIGLGKISQD